MDTALLEAVKLLGQDSIELLYLYVILHFALQFAAFGAIVWGLVKFVKFLHTDF